MVLVGCHYPAYRIGLSITEWNVVTGTFPPITQEDWHEEFEKYKESPEYRLKNRYVFGDGDEALQNFKQIFFWEWLHRFLGRFIGVVFSAFHLVCAKGYFKPKIYPRLLVIFVLAASRASCGHGGW